MASMSPDQKLAAKQKKTTHKRMIQLDKSVTDLLKQGEKMAVVPLVPGGEEEVVRNQQLAASMMLATCHIQLHRRQAFPEVALFSRKMCGLPKAPLAPASDTPTPNKRFSSVTSGSQSKAQTESPYMSPAASGKADFAMDAAADMTNRTPPNPMLNINNPNQMYGFDGVQDPMLASVISNSNGDPNDLSSALDGFLFDSSIYPSSLPMPWFTSPDRAGDLYKPTEEPTTYMPGIDGIFTAETGYMGPPVQSYNDGSNGIQSNPTAGTSALTETSQIFPGHQAKEANQSQLQSSDSSPAKSSPAPKPHKAWGVDIAQAPTHLSIDDSYKGSSNDGDVSDETESVAPVVVGPDGPFPPGMSLTRIAQAAHTVIRLEVLHRSAGLALWKGPPKWLPFCACGMLSSAYSFLLLTLAVQSSQAYKEARNNDETSEELDALITNVKIILAGLEAYGSMWDGINLMAGRFEATRALMSFLRHVY